MTETKDSWIDSLRVYKDIRMVRILLLGAISGFPWVLIASSLSLWLKEEGLSRSTIGWAGLIFGVYAFNYLWAPLIDRIRIPWLTNKVGHRRGWIILMQLVILLSLISWNFLDPKANLGLVITVGLIIAIEIIKELPITLIMRPFNFETFATTAYIYASQDLLEAAAVPSLFLILITSTFILITSRYTLRD